MLHARAGQSLQVAVAEVVFERGANVLMREVDAADAFVVRRKRDGHVRGAVEREGMLGRLTPRMPSFEVRLISTMMCFAPSLSGVPGRSSCIMSTPWPMRSAWPSSTAWRMWKRRPSGGTRPGASSPACRLMCTFGIDAVQVVEHLHLQRVVAHGEVAVLRHDEVDADQFVLRVHRCLHRSKPSSVCAKTCCGGKPRSTW